MEKPKSERLIEIIKSAFDSGTGAANDNNLEVTSKYTEDNGVISGYSLLTMVIHDEYYAENLKKLNTLLEIPELKEALDSGLLGKEIKSYGSKIGIKKVEIHAEENKGDYERMKDPGLSIAEEEGYFERKDPKTLYEEEMEEEKRVGRRHY